MISPVWDRAKLAMRLLAIDPTGLGGAWVRARSGPVRDYLTRAIHSFPGKMTKIHNGISDEQLFGGVDLSSTLATGKVVLQQGLLQVPQVLILPMAERCPAELAARISGALDKQHGHSLIALDEGFADNEGLPSALTDRLALHLDLEDLPLGETDAFVVYDPKIEAAIDRLANVSVPAQTMTDLTITALRLGVISMRAPLLALRAAKAHAAMNDRSEVNTDDLLAAAELVLAPRATQFPTNDDDDPLQPPEPPETQPDDMENIDTKSSATGDTMQAPIDLILEATAAMLPQDLLDRVATQAALRTATASNGAGSKTKGNRRGRPIPSRQGRLDGISRIDLIATLRAASPWQPLRQKMAAQKRDGIMIRPTDIRTKRFTESSDRLLIFVVDASGSAAMTRLSEAKGAVELLLAEAYARRDHVALVAFRGEGANILLPPTRSLVQTKRRLAALPGGGGTPLAAGLKAAMEMSIAARGKGMSPTVALLTDGKANIALDGTANRQAANDDATNMALKMRKIGTPSLVIDMGPRAQRPLEALAQTMAAPYIPLPRADAKRLSAAVSTALEG